jgi:Na+:H+ antiporter, NhaA family
VIAALAIPLSDGKGGSPLRTAEHALHPWVAFVVLPLFAFVNAGVSLGGVSIQTFLSPVPAGIALGLLLGKATGVFGASWLLMRFGGAALPQGATRLQFFAVCVLCGIGFTMSLFIGGLAFEGLGAEIETQLKLGVLVGSLLSALLGVGLMLHAPRAAADQ